MPVPIIYRYKTNYSKTYQLKITICGLAEPFLAGLAWEHSRSCNHMVGCLGKRVFLGQWASHSTYSFTRGCLYDFVVS